MSSCDSKQMIENDKQFHEIFNNWRRFDILTAVFSMTGLVLAVTNYEIDVHWFSDEFTAAEVQDVAAMDTKRFNDKTQ